MSSKKLSLVSILVFLAMVERGWANFDQCPNVKKPLSHVRKRRHLTFPDGTTVSMTTSVVKTFMTHVPSGWYLVIEASLVYHLPDTKTQISAHRRKKLHHRQKREFWDTLREALDIRNINGESCVIRSICEAKTHLAPPGKSLVHDILRAIFTAPLHEEEFNEEIGRNYRRLLEPDVCEKENDCPFSILNFIFQLNNQNY
ncbi:uncharacterized protein LOC115444162 [Manduca sexta]|uniref:Uncharacterized protein n=1 Tax=Manduca sexta TaxID=7130 RepID=A0A921Z5S1_MANSE|nr:uncharacterized protein LOC115444162 [Manduca sexta]KAG6451059.1 hypothetical protein O3G_MSEX006909 [Manduca sexta]